MAASLVLLNYVDFLRFLPCDLEDATCDDANKLQQYFCHWDNSAEKEQSNSRFHLQQSSVDIISCFIAVKFCPVLVVLRNSGDKSGVLYNVSASSNCERGRGRKYATA